MPQTCLTHLECSLCSKKFEPGRPWNLCDCGGPLLARYDLARLKSEWRKESLASAVNSMWRYAPALPVSAQTSIISLGEGMTPLLHLRRTSGFWLKDEGLNPTGSFKARGLSCAVSMCVELGIKAIAIPSAGNAASALAAYTAAAGIEAHIYMPSDVPQANFIECKAYGAQVTLVNGLISDCGRIVAEKCKTEGWFDISTLKEPYRIEGKKTMGYELAEQMNWTLPDAILYPAGGGVGMIGMWKAFAEMEALGWIGPKRPKMIAVQAEGCQPIVRAFEQGTEASQFWEGASTVAAGLRVPKPLGDRLTLAAVRESGGCAIAVSDSDLMDAGLRLASKEGIFAAPEGASCVAAAERLVREGFLKPDDQIVVYNTGSGLKYLEAYSVRFPRSAAGETDKLGGLITPR
ncbi:MAG TPA: threonine synthase [Bryobacteraceae bacterium]|nr:threonine synthase [Bryobacteraceae bacterium]